MSRFFGAFVLILSMLLAAVSSATAATVEIVVAGEAFDGSPVLHISSNGVGVGGGEVSTAIDTVAEGRLRATEALLHSKRFSAVVPDDAGEVEFSLANDMAGEDGHDRNLYILSVTVDGTALALSDLRYLRDGVETDLPQSTPWLPLFKESDVALLSLTQAAPEVATGQTPVSGGRDDCSAQEVVITGFARNSATIPADQKKALNDVVTQSMVEACAVEVIGYSSPGGSETWNQRLSQLRSTSVLDYLIGEGATFAYRSAKGNGATREFGSGTVNQRVVIKVLVP